MSGTLSPAQRHPEDAATDGDLAEALAAAAADY